jgi:hypothetical protein
MEWREVLKQNESGGCLEWQKSGFIAPKRIPIIGFGRERRRRGKKGRSWGSTMKRKNNSRCSTMPPLSTIWDH